MYPLAVATHGVAFCNNPALVVFLIAVSHLAVHFN